MAAPSLVHAGSVRFTLKPSHTALHHMAQNGADATGAPSLVAPSLVTPSLVTSSVVALELAEALAARLCHDLAGPVGTIGGMLDLAAEVPEEGAEALPQARQAALTLRQRLRLLRAAWGPDTGDTDLPSLVALAGHERLSVQLDATAAEQASQPGEARLLLNVILLGAETLRGTGTLTVRPAAASATRILAVALADPAVRRIPTWPDTGVADPADPRAFQAAWTARLAAECRATLRPAGTTLHVHLAP